METMSPGCGAALGRFLSMLELSLQTFAQFLVLPQLLVVIDLLDNGPGQPFLLRIAGLEPGDLGGGSENS